MQLRPYNYRTDNSLRGNTDNHDGRQHHQIASTRAAVPGGDCGERDCDCDEEREDAVDLFDRGVPRRDVDERVVVAVRPVDAAEPGAGKAHSRAGHDDDAQQGECRDADRSKFLRREALAADAAK